MTIEDLRKKAFLTQAKAAERAGISANYWYGIEAGRHTPHCQVIPEIAKALNVEPEVVVSALAETRRRARG